MDDPRLEVVAEYLAPLLAPADMDDEERVRAARYYAQKLLEVLDAEGEVA